MKPLAPLLSTLTKRLDLYSLAAGFGIFASASPAHAKIVFTPANIPITPDHTLLIDLNHDGINDFELHDASDGVLVNPLQAGGAMVRGRRCTFGKGPAALHAGMSIGKTRAFLASATCMASFSLDASFSFGSWAGGVSNRFLGLQFQINGQTHFGWARLTVTKRPYTATLTGYAYETVANQAIIAGKTSGSEDSTVSRQSPVPEVPLEPPTLGILALGAARFEPEAFRRRERSGSLLPKS